MIDAQSSAWAFGNSEGCRKLAGDNIPGKRPMTTPRPGGAPEYMAGIFLKIREIGCSSQMRSYPVKPGQTKKSNWNQTGIRPGKSILNLFNPTNCYPLYDKAIHRLKLKSYFANTCHSSICICLIQKLIRVSRCHSMARKAKQAKRPQNFLPNFFRHFDGKSLGNHIKNRKKTIQNHAKNTRILTCLKHELDSNPNRKIEMPPPAC